MSPATMCSLATSTARWYSPSGIELLTSGSASPASGGSTGTYGNGRARLATARSIEAIAAS